MFCAILTFIEMRGNLDVHIELHTITAYIFFSCKVNRSLTSLKRVKTCDAVFCPTVQTVHTVGDGDALKPMCLAVY